ncbi:MAG TPA: DUF4465 domain-containing protein [Saprospiraceae bacterium]|nr:DUF4465 domain-containing protein [Saprospiraceae bacterium]
MVKFSFALIFSIAIGHCFSQAIAGFEDFNLEPGQYLNDASPERGFRSGSIELPNNYNAEFDFWSGFAISADTNTTTPGFSNQYSSITGSGALGTTAYAVGYIYDNTFVRLTGKATGKPMIGMYVTNSTYAALSMRDGDSFAKKFGGESGKDPDFFLLTIKKYAGGAIADDSINVYLADYRSSSASKDYILTDWKYVDLTSIGEVDSLVLRLSSSDVGTFGMNTPAYVCIDQVSTDNLLSASSLSRGKATVKLSPNPVRETLFIDLPAKGTCTIFDIRGRTMWSDELESGQHRVSVMDYAKGIYFVSFNGRFASRFSIN